MQENIEIKNEERCYVVYKHISPSGKCYIGITRQSVENRWRNGYGYKVQQYFWRAIQKYGWKNFKHEILFENLTKEEAEEKEVELIAYYKSNQYGYGYNIENGGSSIGKMSDETKRKLSEINKRENLSKETLKKRSDAKIGTHLSEETKRKMSESWYNNHQDSNCKRVAQYTKDGKFIKQWNSASEAGKILNINKSLIAQCCRKERKTTFGFIWKYINEDFQNKYLSQDEIFWHNKKIFSHNKRILQYSKDGVLIGEYKDANEASLFTGIKSNYIYRCCNGERNTANGFIWRYADDKNNEFRQAI